MIVLFSLVNGALMAKYSFYWPWYFSGGALVLTGASLMCESIYDTPFAPTAVLNIAFRYYHQSFGFEQCLWLHSLDRCRNWVVSTGRVYPLPGPRQP